MAGQVDDADRSWGRIVRGPHAATRPSTVEQAIEAVRARNGRSLLGHGNGRSYGDVGLNPAGTLIDCSGLNTILAFDPATGILTCEAGVVLADILQTICAPDPDGGGWFLPVTPGTRYITVGGAIANDVHGKNHHQFGTFGRHVLSFDLLRSDGAVLTCSPHQNAPLFAATIAGLGLTGLILRATIQMRRVPGLAIEAEDIRFDSHAEFFDLSRESDEDWEYTAAWVDCLAAGKKLGRGIYSRGRHAPGKTSAPPARNPRFNIPFAPPISLVNEVSVRAFNALYWRKLGLGRTRINHVVGYDTALYPLDGIGRWNLLYGPRGLFQFQCVIPPADARGVVAEMLAAIVASGQGSMLSVLKVFGDTASPGLLSFPMPGAALALDFPNRGEATNRLLARLEAMAVEAGGRIYPAKDGAMSGPSMQAGYAHLESFRQYIDPGFSSAFARRVGLLPA